MRRKPQAAAADRRVDFLREEVALQLPQFISIRIVGKLKEHNARTEFGVEGVGDLALHLLQALNQQIRQI